MLPNHLGNVLVTISDRKLDTVADIYTAQDYYPFGMQMPERSYSYGGRYRFNFNGKETDPSTGLQDYGFRIYNPAIGEFLSVDPLAPDYPWNSTYCFAEGDVIRAIDLDGLEKFIVTTYTLDFRGRPTGRGKAIVRLDASSVAAQRRETATAGGPLFSFDGGRTWSTDYRYEELEPLSRAYFGYGQHADVFDDDGNRLNDNPNTPFSSKPSGTSAPTVERTIMLSDFVEADNINLIYPKLIEMPQPSINRDFLATDEDQSRTITNTHDLQDAEAATIVTLQFQAGTIANDIRVTSNDGTVYYSANSVLNTTTQTFTIPAGVDNTLQVSISPSDGSDVEKDGWFYTINYDTEEFVEP